MGEQAGVIIQRVDGTRIEGRLVRPFNQVALWIELIDAKGDKHSISMDDIECLLFLHPDGAQSRTLRHLPNDVIEDVYLRSGATFTVITNAHQAEVNGFFGFPDPEEHPDIQRIFFVQGNVLGRKLAVDPLQTAKLEHKPEREQAAPNKPATQAKPVPPRTKPGLHVGEIFLRAGLITQEQLDEALAEQKRHKHRRIGDILIAKGAIDEEQMLACLAEQLRIQFVDLSTMEPEPDALMELSAPLARELHVVPLKLQGHVLQVVTSDPNDLDVITKLQFHTGRRIQLVLARKDQIEEKIRQYYPEQVVEDLDIEMLEQEDDEFKSAEALTNEAEQTPIVRLANRILKDGVEANASDIHIMVREGRVVVDLRINGVLSEYMNFNASVLNPLITRFKIIARMDIAEHRLPQDGRIRLRLQGRDVEFRVSCVPSVHGETLVLRILERKKDRASLRHIGLLDEDLATMQRICRSDHGLVLITGPTGSGKSTTMVSAISDLLGKGKRLISLEDPVEAEVPGVLQVQVHSKIGFTFARALRNLLRHDPDIIMVGEIRDGETAEIAVEAALTGHLLFSSLHTNTAAGAFVRLINMGIEPYLVAATVKGVMAQRLLPLMCPHCKQTVTLADDVRLVLEHAGGNPDAAYYAAEGCNKCRYTGIAGRRLVYELIEVNERISKLVVESAPEHVIKTCAEEEGMRSLGRMALALAERGEVALNAALPLLLE